MKIRKSPIAVLISAAWLIVIGVQCSPSVTTHKLSEQDLSRYKTYAYLPNSDTVKYADCEGEVVEQIVMQELNREMQKIGYRVDKEQPDLLIKTHVMFEQEQQQTTNPVYANYPYYYSGYSVGYTSPYYYSGYANVPRVVGNNVDEITYTEGTIAIDVIDAKTNEIIWRGWAEDPIDPDDFATEVQTYVDEVFDEYPVEDGEVDSAM